MLKHTRGFTLIELLITIAIIGLIAVVAYPAYDNYIKKSRRTEAKTTLMEMAQKQEDYRSDTNAYTGSISNLRMSWDAPGDVWPCQDEATITQPKQYYCFKISSASKSSYELQATLRTNWPIDEKCGIFVLKHTGEKKVLDAEGKELDGKMVKECWE